MNHINSKEQLSKEEIEFFKNGTPKAAKIMTILQCFFGGCLGIVYFIIFIVGIVKWMLSKYAIEYLLAMAGMAIVLAILAIIMILCMREINSRNRKLYQALLDGKYCIIHTTVKDVKTFYINKHGKGWPIAKKYYVCTRPNEKVWPVSEKEARQVKMGDKIKVLIISADVFGYSVCYGKAE